ncbi:MAG: DNA repair protein RadC [Parcubacteria group bacterium]
MKLGEMPKSDRPREKLVKYGAGKLSNTELLAIILGSGVKGLNVIELANKILKKFGSDKLKNAQYDDLKKTFGLGQAKACEIIACLEFGKRLLKDKPEKLVLQPEDVYRELRDLRQNKKEHFVVFYLDTHSREIKRETISIGTLNANLIHPREVFESAIKNNAAQIIVAHNHPSGIVDPSEDDIKITKRLVDAGKLLGIDVLDHIIVGDAGYFSFKNKNII